jgi:hypothetical protein
MQAKAIRDKKTGQPALSRFLCSAYAGDYSVAVVGLGSTLLVAAAVAAV